MHSHNYYFQLVCIIFLCKTLQKEIIKTLMN